MLISAHSPTNEVLECMVNIKSIQSTDPTSAENQPKISINISLAELNSECSFLFLVKLNIK